MTRLVILAVLALAIAGAFFYLRTGSGGGAATAAFMGREPDALVVDVRTPAEFATGHVAGARNVDVHGDFAAQMDAVDRDQPVYVYCRTGRRSGQAQRTLTEMGFERVVNAGGFRDLAAAGAPTE